MCWIVWLSPWVFEVKYILTNDECIDRQTTSGRDAFLFLGVLLVLAGFGLMNCANVFD